MATYTLRYDDNHAAHGYLKLSAVRTIEHSGHTFSTEVIGLSALNKEWGHCSIWPIEEFLSRVEITPGTAQKVKRLNKSGKHEVDYPVGFWREGL